MAKIQHGLGKGLGALLGGEDISQLRKPVGYINKEVATTGGVKTTADVLRIPLSMIEPNPFQPRTGFKHTPIVFGEKNSVLQSLGEIFKNHLSRICTIVIVSEKINHSTPCFPFVCNISCDR